jgi:hypothetical protein
MFTGKVRDNAHRWPIGMYEEWPDLHKHAKFHRQFITLTRNHAVIVDQDSFVSKLFEKHCFIGREK